MPEYKILVVSRSFYPTISPRSFRATELAREMARQGHKVKVITSFRSDVDYNTISKEFGISFKDLGREKLRSLKLTGIKIKILLNRLINRILLMLIEFPDIQIAPLTVRALRNEDNYDLIITIAVPYPIHWGVAWARTRRHRIAKTWVADCGDPYMGDRIDTFRKLFYFRYVEKWFCRKADYLTIPIESGIEGYYKEFHGKIRVIPQGFRFDEINLPQTVFNEPISFAYAGNVVPVNRDPRPFLEYLCTIEKDFRFYFYTKKTELIRSYKDILGDKLIINDYIPRDKLLSVLASMDFLVNFDNNTTVHCPSKLIDYALVKRPVLNITSTNNEAVILAFLNRNYSDALKFTDILRYKIDNVAGLFLGLI